MVTNDDRLGEIAAFASAVFGPDATGLAHWAIGVGGHFNGTGKYEFEKWLPQTEFAYPSMSGKPYRDMLDAAAESDVYLDPYLMNGSKRTKTDAVNPALLHTDWDGELADLPACLEKIAAIGGFAAMSGTPGHLHIYVRLAQPVTAKRHGELLAALARYLPPGCDTGKKAVSDVLRVVGTFHHKGRARGGQSAPVTWAIPPTGVAIDPDTLAQLLGTVATGQQPRTAAYATHPMPPAADVFPEAVRAALALDTGERSDCTAHVVGACVDAGLTLDETRAAVSSRADLASKVAEFSARTPQVDDVLNLWIQITDSRQQHRREEQTTQADWKLFLAPYRKRERPSAAAQSGTTGSAPSMKLWKAADLKTAAQPKFLAKNRIPQAAITILIGEEGIGKSLLWVLIAAAITTGTAMPEFGIPEHEPATVILILTEDEWDSAVRPRLEVAHANLDNIEVLCTEDDGTGSPTFPADMHLITDANPAPALVVCDAWLDTVPQRLQVRDPQQSRLALHPWKEAAGQTKAAMMLLAHSNRLETANIRDRYGASASLRQKARMTLYCLGDGETLYAGPDKSNGAAARTKATVFRITAIQHFAPTPDHDGTVPLLEIVGQSDKTIKEHLAEAFEAERTKNKSPSAAELWLREFLSSGRKRATAVYDAGATLGFSVDQLKRAKGNVNKSKSTYVNTFQEEDLFADKSYWWWELQLTQEDGERAE
jgi:hypothetical protein